MKGKPNQEEFKKQYAVNMAVTSFMNSSKFFISSDEITLKKVYDDLDIRSAINSRVLELQGRNIKVVSKNKDIESAKKILDRFNKVDFSNLIDWTMQAKWFRYSITELLWGDNFNIIGTKRQLRKYFDLIYENGKYEWYFVNGVEKVKVESYKALVTQNNADDENAYGYTDFEPLLKIFYVKEHLLECVHDVTKKYLGAITWFVFNSEAPDADKQYEEMVESLSGMGTKTVIGIPASASGMQGYNKDFGIFPLTDVSVDIHMAIESWIEKSISKYFLGATLTQDTGNTGSYAASKTHQEIREDIITGDVNFLKKEFQKLIEIDAMLYGYNSNDFYFELMDKEDEVQIEATLKAKADRISTLSQNYDISEEYVSEQQGIPLQYITKKQSQTFGGGFGFNKEYAASNSILKRINEQKKSVVRFNDSIDSVKKKVNKALSDNIKETINNIKSLDDIRKISLNFPKEFLNIYILSFLSGQLDVLNMNNSIKEFAEEIDIFNVTYDDAIKYLQNKMPILYDELDDITEEMTEKYFWIKKSTDLEITKKVQKSLLDSLKNGKSFADWKNEVSEDFGKMGIEADGSYINNVYRTNMQSNYAAGRYVRQEKQKEYFKYWQFFAIEDEVTTDICRELDGKIYRADDDIWNKIYPPLHYNCYSQDTEVLTNKGWIKFNEYDINNKEIKFASINPTTKELEYINAKNKIAYNYNGKMIRFKSNSFDLLVTPEHNQCFVSKWHKDKNKDEKLRFKKSKEIATSDIIPRIVEYNSGINYDKIKISDIEFDTGDFMEFLGWYLGDGNISMKYENTNYFQIKITQISDAYKINDIFNLSKRLFKNIFNVYKWQEGIYITGNNEVFYDWFNILGKCYCKYIPEEIKKYSKKYLERLLLGLVKTDGSIYDNKKNNLGNYDFKSFRVFYTSSLQLANDIGEIIFKCGKLPSFDYSLRNQGKIQKFKNGEYEIKHDVYKIFELNTKNYSHKKKYVSEIDYNDMVYCVELEKNHTLYVRRNGKCTWSGNCRSTVIALSDYDVENMQSEAVEGQNTIEIESGEYLKEMQVFKDFETTSFAGNPYKNFLEEKKASIKDKEAKINENEKAILKLIG